MELDGREYMPEVRRTVDGDRTCMSFRTKVERNGESAEGGGETVDAILDRDGRLHRPEEWSSDQHTTLAPGLYTWREVTEKEWYDGGRWRMDQFVSIERSACPVTLFIATQSYSRGYSGGGGSFFRHHAVIVVAE